MRCCVQWAEESKAHWVAVSWDGNKSDPIILARMRERAETLQEIANVTVEMIEEAKT